MSVQQKIKVTDFSSLQLEKQRLSAICEVKKQALEENFAELKKNYPEIVFSTFLPFDAATNAKIFRGIKWITGTLGKYVDPATKIGKMFSGKNSNIIQASLVYLVIRLGKRIFSGKRK
jgi:hypothetical protein